MKGCHWVSETGKMNYITGKKSTKKALVGIVHMLDTPVTTRIAYFLYILGNIL